MQQKIKEYIVRLLEQKGPIPSDTSVDDYAFLDNGHIDSLGLMKFLVAVEKEFGIELTENDIMSKQFRTVSGLAKLIAEKQTETA